MIEIIERTLMECTSGGSNKFYEVTLSKVNETYLVTARWGRKGGTQLNRDLWKTKGGQIRTKYQANQIYPIRARYNQIIRDKKSRGYREVVVPEPTIEETRKREEETSNKISLERFSMLEF